jgi:lipid-A-disaccharide synthase
MAKADFLPDALIRDFPAPRPDRTWQAHRVTFHEDVAARWFQTAQGTRIAIASNAEVLAQADLALTIPGTNTGEIAACGIPMVVVLPTYLAEIVPLPGLAGHLGRLPWVGAPLKRVFGRQVLKHLPLLALPNRRAGRQIVPEFVGRGLLPAVEASLEGLLAADLAALGAEVRAAMGPPGAAARLVGAISDHFPTPAALTPAAPNPPG